MISGRLYLTGRTTRAISVDPDLPPRQTGTSQRNLQAQASVKRGYVKTRKIRKRGVSRTDAFVDRTHHAYKPIRQRRICVPVRSFVPLRRLITHSRAPPPSHLQARPAEKKKALEGSKRLCRAVPWEAKAKAGRRGSAHGILAEPVIQPASQPFPPPCGDRPKPCWITLHLLPLACLVPRPGEGEEPRN
jgi:hypothetical protein